MRSSSSKTGSASRAKKTFLVFPGILKIYCVEFGLVFLYNEFYSRFELHFRVNVSCILPVFFQNNRNFRWLWDHHALHLQGKAPPPRILLQWELWPVFSRIFLSFSVFNNDFVFKAQFLEWFWEMHFCSLVENENCDFQQWFFVSQDTCQSSSCSRFLGRGGHFESHQLTS